MKLAHATHLRLGGCGDICLIVISPSRGLAPSQRAGLCPAGFRQTRLTITATMGARHGALTRQRATGLKLVYCAPVGSTVTGHPPLPPLRLPTDREHPHPDSPARVHGDRASLQIRMQKLKMSEQESCEFRRTQASDLTYQDNGRFHRPGLRDQGAEVRISRDDHPVLGLRHAHDLRIWAACRPCIAHVDRVMPCLGQQFGNAR